MFDSPLHLPSLQAWDRMPNTRKDDPARREESWINGGASRLAVRRGLAERRGRVACTHAQGQGGRHEVDNDDETKARSAPKKRAPYVARRWRSSRAAHVILSALRARLLDLRASPTLRGSLCGCSVEVSTTNLNLHFSRRPLRSGTYPALHRTASNPQSRMAHM